VIRLLGEARESDLAEALRRHRAIKGETPRDQIPESDRTICRWEEQYRVAEAKYGHGFVGLLPGLRNCGNRRPRFPQQLLEVMETVYTEQYLTKKAKSAKRAYEQLQLQCERQGLRALSCKTWLKFIRKHSKYAAALARQGKRVAYQCQSDRPGHHRVDGPTATWPWKKAHLDHTRIDAEAVDKETGKRIDRPWLSILWDEATTRILAIYVSYDSPSFRSCMGVLRECVRRHGRLPESIVVDNGPEFRSIYFETVAALFRVTLMRRPPGMPRYGSGCERTFGIVNQEFFHVLAGNTKITRNVRQVTKSVNPRALALWSLEEMDEALCVYAYDIYEHREVPGLHMSPAQAYAQGIKHCGERPNRMISYNRDFTILTMPSTRTGRAKVQTGVGIKVNRIWYWNDRMAEPEIEGSHLDVRFDPDDMGHVFAQIKGAWVECQSEYYHVFHGRSDREITFASREVSALNGLHDQKCAVYGKRLAEFLEKVEGQERLMEQRIRDLAQRRVQEAHEGKARGGGEPEPPSPAEPAASPTSAKSNIVPIPTAHANAETGEAPLRVFAEF
jgi:transposase InsO family protein